MYKSSDHSPLHSTHILQKEDGFNVLIIPRRVFKDSPTAALHEQSHPSMQGHNSMANGDAFSLEALGYVVYSYFSPRHVRRSLFIRISIACRLNDIDLTVFEQDMVYISFGNGLFGFAWEWIPLERSCVWRRVRLVVRKYRVSNILTGFRYCWSSCLAKCRKCLCQVLSRHHRAIMPIEGPEGF